jgi:DNA-binding NarL/FixJ family response regulator
MNTRARVLLAEADGPTRAGLRVVLTAEGYEVVAEALDGATAIELGIEQRPDAALIATDLPGGGIEATAALAARLPGTRFVLLSPRLSGEELVAAVLAGAAGYLPKEISLRRLPHALRGVLEGEVALPRRYSQHLLEKLRGRQTERSVVRARTNADLTDREWEVLHLLAERASTAEIAHRLRITEVTVRRHISAVLGKLGAPDRETAIRLLRRSHD